MKEKEWMDRCELLGKNAGDKGNSPVGALIVQQGEVVAEAEEAATSKKDVTCHAEIEVLRLAVKILGTNDLSDCVLYTTHEPCVMCSYAIRFYKIKKVVYRNGVKYLGGIHSSFPVLVTDEVPERWGSAPQIIQLRS